MENKDYRETIGKRLEEALREEDFEDLEDLIEMPSIETFNKWVEEVDQRREKKFRIRKIASMCAVFAITVALIALALAIKGFAVPDVEADPEQERSIDNSMETTATYESWSELPDEIKEQFIEFKNFPDGYEVESVEVEEGKTITKVMIIAEKEKEHIVVRQMMYRDGSLDSNIVSFEENIEMCEGLDVYVKQYNDSVKEETYCFVKDNLLVDITVAEDVNETEIQSLIEEAAQ